MGRTIAVITSAALFAVIGLLTSILAVPEGGETVRGFGPFEVMVAKFAAPGVGAVVGLIIGCIAVIASKVDRSDL